MGATFLRSFLVQGAWNYHTMLGTGFAFALLPGLRRLYRQDPDALEAAIRRHTEHFNAHPYLTGVALGAALRLEQEGADEGTVRRFKTAVRGPLGSLGDRLVWASWLPAVALASLVIYWLGAGWAWSSAFFLVVYNAGHLALRVWGLRAGWSAGREVAGRLRAAGLGELAERLGPVGAVLSGLLCGVLGAGPLADAGDGGLWVALASAGFVLGLAAGHRAWRAAAVGTVVAVAAVVVVSSLPGGAG